jgi:hypothetical protein
MDCRRGERKFLPGVGGFVATTVAAKGVSVECACESVGGRQLINTINVIRKPYQSIFCKTFQMESLETRRG